NPEPDIAGYRLYYGTSSGTYPQMFDVGNTTGATVSNLAAGSRYYFAVTAYDTSYLESLPSDEVIFDATPEPIPGPPVAQINSVRLLWGGTVQFEVGEFRSDIVAPGGIDVEVSEDLVTWTVLVHLSPPFEPVSVTDPAAEGAERRFYRLAPR
ncbi:MAG: fibronectin type III domain-containing protein, partial [Chthoniobacteraceae bacterium]